MALKLQTVIMLALVALTLAAARANAHSPYLRDMQPYETADGKRFSIGMLYGDGIMASDPGRPVVLNEEGQVVALGPKSFDGFAICRAVGDCAVFLAGASQQKVEPEPRGFGPPREPDFYPEHEKVEYGFRNVPLTFSDYAVFWTVPFRRAPILAIGVCLLFVIAGFALVRSGVRMIQFTSSKKFRLWRALAEVILLLTMSLGVLVILIFTSLIHGGFFMLEIMLLGMTIGMAASVLSLNKSWMPNGK